MGKVRVTVISLNMLPLIRNIYVKLYSDIPYSKGTIGQKPFFRPIKGG